MNSHQVFHLNKFFKKASLTGIDVDGKLLNKAKKICPKNIVFLKKNISNNNLKIGKFDIIILSGVLSIFKNGEKILKNISAEAWGQWLEMQTMFINENQLNMMEAQARTFLTARRNEFLFEGGEKFEPPTPI